MAMRIKRIHKRRKSQMTQEIKTKMQSRIFIKKCVELVALNQMYILRGKRKSMQF